MRQIKFRAWDSQNNQWLLGYDYKNLGGFSMFGEIMLMDEWNAAVHAHHKAKVYINLMQYSGLKDINGREIYEGDIVYLAGYGNYEVTFPFYQLYTSSFEGDIGEIKGNIYENPELLEDN